MHMERDRRWQISQKVPEVVLIQGVWWDVCGRVRHVAATGAVYYCCFNHYVGMCDHHDQV